MEDLPTAGPESVWGQQFTLEELSTYNMMVVANTELPWNVIE